jgi:hypothetical protein
VATSAGSNQEGSTMNFDPVPRQASEYQKGAAFGHATVMRQIDGGVPSDQIQQTQDAAKLTLAAAARTDGEREFCAGYTAAVNTRIATLHAAQRAEADCTTRLHRSGQQPTAWLEPGSQRTGQAPGGLRIGPNQARESDVEAGLEAGG